MEFLLKENSSYLGWIETFKDITNHKISTKLSSLGYEEFSEFKELIDPSDPIKGYKVKVTFTVDLDAAREAGVTVWKGGAICKLTKPNAVAFGGWTNVIHYDISGEPKFVASENSRAEFMFVSQQTWTFVKKNGVLSPDMQDATKPEPTDKPGDPDIKLYEKNMQVIGVSGDNHQAKTEPPKPEPISSEVEKINAPEPITATPGTDFPNGFNLTRTKTGVAEGLKAKVSSISTKKLLGVGNLTVMYNQDAAHNFTCNYFYSLTKFEANKLVAEMVKRGLADGTKQMYYDCFVLEYMDANNELIARGFLYFYFTYSESTNRASIVVRTKVGDELQELQFETKLTD